MSQPPVPLRPYAWYWFPDSLPAGRPGDGITWGSLAAWTPEGDRDLAFNTATVPLAERFTPVPANTTARAGQARSAVTGGRRPPRSPAQDRLPPRRWSVRIEGQRPDVSLGFADAWRGGCSLLVRGALGSSATADRSTRRIRAVHELGTGRDRPSLVAAHPWSPPTPPPLSPWSRRHA